MIDHLQNDKVSILDGTRLQENIYVLRSVSHSPIEQQQQSQDRQIGGGDIGVLLEAHKDNDNQCGWDDVVTLKKKERKEAMNNYILIVSVY